MITRDVQVSCLLFLKQRHLDAAGDVSTQGKSWVPSSADLDIQGHTGHRLTMSVLDGHLTFQ